ncbi:MAG: basic amino acid ABC transporter substrate-binding protein [Lachnospiraceae bacterium]|jgi:polar amino acid transport system substrate-binding protein|nr:basic amino acid ABC transporter substrate-binding protein [Lachnospiraceae bacterium]
MKKFFACIITASLMLGVLASCSSDDGVLTVGTNADFPPFEYIGDNGEPDGFDIALIKEIGSRIGREIVIEDMEFSALIAAIGSRIDVAIAAMTVTEERRQTVDFSEPYYEAIQYVIVPVESDISSMADLEGLTIGVQLGTTGDFIAEDIEGAVVIQYVKGLDAVNDLLNGRVDCVIIDRNPALVFVERHDGILRAVEGYLFGFDAEYYAIAMPKGDTDLATQINQALRDIKADGTYDRLVRIYIEES